VALKVRAILNLSQLDDAENAPNNANQSSSVISNVVISKNESLARRPDDGRREFEDAAPVLVSSFEEDLSSSSQAASSFFDGELSTAQGNISPILVKKSPVVEDVHFLGDDRPTALNLHDDDGDKKCSICPIC